MAGFGWQLHAYHVGRLETLGAFQQIELHCLAFVECAVTILLDRGEMHEDVFARGALDESITLGPVKPLHCTLLSHKLLLSPLTS
jgi:hypothetical protein